MLATVSDNSMKYTKRAYDKAMMARKLQNIIMRPSSRKYKDVIVDYLRDCPVTKADIQAAEDIFGPNLGSLKGKTVRRPNEHVVAGMDAVPAEILELHDKMTLAIDIMFVNKIAFFVTTCREIKFGTVEALPNRRITTVKDCLKKVVDLYHSRGLIVGMILADNEFEPLRPWFPTINTCAADEHVPDVERYVRTVKDRSRSTYRMLPYKYLPRIVVVHLVRNAVFWLNAFPTDEGITRKYSPRYVMTGQQLSASKHARIEFGAYVQTHEEHSNDMNQRTMGCICLGPNGNQQGGHWFMSLSSGERVVRNRWTELPMPREAIDRVSAIGRRQGMPSTLTYANRHGREIGDTVEDYAGDDDSDSDDETYDNSEQSDDDNDDDDDDSKDDSDSDDDDSSDEEEDDDDGDEAAQIKDAELQSAPRTAPTQLQQQDPVIFAGQAPMQPAQGVQNQGVEGNNQGVDNNPPLPHADIDVETVEDDDSDADEDEERTDNEYERFRAAEADGRARANQPTAERPKRNAQKRNDDDFIYTVFDCMQQAAGVEASNAAFVTAQMSAKAGLKMFGTKGADALMKELGQLIVMKVMSGCNSRELTPDQKKKSLKYLMFLKEKRCGRIKGRGCADGRKQRVYKTKIETSSPTVSIESLMLSCMIDAMEARDIATCDIPGAFMQADIDEEIHVKFDGELVDLLLKVDPTLGKYVTMERGKKVL
jgi:hypothetical protein